MARSARSPCTTSFDVEDLVGAATARATAARDRSGLISTARTSRSRAIECSSAIRARRRSRPMTVGLGRGPSSLLPNQGANASGTARYVAPPWRSGAHTRTTPGRLPVITDPGLDTADHVSVAVITGSAGLIGSEAALHFGGLGMQVVGVDNDMRRVFFGEDGSTAWNVARLAQALGAGYDHRAVDVRDREGIDALFARFGRDIALVVHAAAQPSHDWAAKEPFTDFDINAGGTLNLLEATRRHCPDASFIFTSTNKVYGDAPNRLPLVEQEKRWEIEPTHPYAGGIGEDMSIDHSAAGPRTARSSRPSSRPSG